MPSGLVTWDIGPRPGGVFGIHNKDNGAKQQQHDKCEARWAVGAHHGEQTRFHGYSFLLGLLDRGQPPESGIAPDTPGGNELTMQQAMRVVLSVLVAAVVVIMTVFTPVLRCRRGYLCVCACGVAVDIGWPCPLERW